VRRAPGRAGRRGASVQSLPVPESLRRRASVALVALTSFVLAGTALCGYTRWEIVDSQAFSSRAAAALDDREVRAVLADRIVDALTRRQAPNALVVRPVAVAAVAALADTPPFRRAFERAIRARHETLFAGDERFVLRLIPDDSLLADLAPIVFRKASTALGRDVGLPLVALDPREFELRAARGIAGFAGWWWPLVALSLLAAGACAALAASVRGALVSLGVALAGAGLLVAAAVAGLGAFVAAHAAQAVELSDESERRAVGALWAALFGDLRTAALFGAAGGAAVAALATGPPVADRLAATARRARATAATPGAWARRGRAVVMLALGAALLLEPALVVRIAAVAAGALLALVGVATLAGGAVGPTQRASGRPPSTLLLATVVAGVAAATVAAVALVLPAPRATIDGAASAGVAAACNGSAALCDRRLDQVVFPATHNSYAAARQPGWFFANQRYGIARQLRDGIRGFLVDVHYGVADPESGRIRTDLRAEGSSRNKVARELSPEALRTADRLVGRVGGGQLAGARRVYMCHTLCELGAEPLGEQLDIFGRFLAANPREVLVLFVEPYVAVDEIERGLRDAGLLSYAAALDRDRPLPTLRELLRSGKRLIVLAEQDGGTRPWYLEAFSFAQDTPYQAASAGEFSCRRYRGEADSPLFLINHWIATFPPSPRRNERVGARVLERRVRECERARGQLPNLIAVDFYERGEVVSIAERLNAR
jgi:hypothetical protein